MVAVHEFTPGYHNSEDEFYCHDTTVNMSLYYYDDDYNPNPEGPPSGDVSLYRPNIEFIMEDLSCQPVLNVVNKADEPNEVVLGWDLLDETQNSWVVTYGYNDFDPETDTPLNTITTATNSGTDITGLLADSTYSFYVKADCGGTDGVSAWTSAYVYGNFVFAGGLGTEVEPYQIATSSHLIKLSQNTWLWDKHFIQTADIDFGSDPLVIDWNGAGDGYDNTTTDTLGFSPIGDNDITWNDIDRQGITFRGSYNGNNHFIKNLFIQRAEESNVGLFGCLAGQVNNLGLEDVNIIGGSDFTGGFVGVLVGSNRAANAIIQNCYVTGSVIGQSKTGGFAGHSGNAIRNCYSSASVTDTAVSSNIGGFVGKIGGSGLLKHCYSTGLITTTSTSNVGGFCGANDNSVVDCYYDNETSGYTTSIAGSGIATADFVDAVNFNGWDFATQWIIGETVSDANGRPRLQWQALEQACENPTNVAVNPTENSGAVTWSSGASEWEVAYGLKGFDLSTVTPETVTTNAYSINGLTENTVYEVYVKAICGVGDESYWAGPISFATVAFDAGSGTEDDPYEIASVADLIKLSQNPVVWEKHFVQTADIDFGSDFLLVDWNGEGDGYDALTSDTLGFSPIGDDDGQSQTNHRQGVIFTGSYDGNNHIVKNMYIHRDEENFVGMFGSMGGQLSNLGLEDCNISGLDFTGSVLGSSLGPNRADDVEIKYCYATGMVKGSERVGGFVGHAGSLITNCYTLVDVEAIADYVGGFSGYVGGNASLVKNYSAGLITYSAGGDVGGFIGYNDGGVSILHNYYDTVTSGQNFSDGGYGMNHAEFMIESNFYKWDFDSEWIIKDGLALDTVLRPSLKWQFPTLSGKVTGADGTLITVTGDVESSLLVVNSGDTYELIVKRKTGVVLTPSKEGFSYEPESVSVSAITQDVMLADFIADANVYPITYHLNEGENNASNPDTYTILTPTIVLADAVKEGYVFDGWYADTAFTEALKVDSIVQGSIGDRVLYASFTETVSVGERTALFEVFPNPTSSYVWLQVNVEGDVSYTVYDLGGRVLATAVIKDAKTQISLNAYEEGIYYIKLTNGKEHQVVKLIKE